MIPGRQLLDSPGLHQGSLLYPDPTSLDFTFEIDTPTAVAYCESDTNPCAGIGCPT
jgi:hypothetical protein